MKKPKMAKGLATLLMAKLQDGQMREY